MPRLLAPLAFFALGCFAVLGYSFITRSPTAVTMPVEAPAIREETPRAASPPIVADPASAPELESDEPLDAAVKPASVDRWVADANSDDAGVRARAISALARAPKSDALPVLQRVLIGGEPEVDRPLALTALRTLAREQGDNDGRVRDVLRQAVYHADGEAVTRGAQAALEDIELDPEGATGASPSVQGP
jgi:hypothetical protein